MKIFIAILITVLILVLIYFSICFVIFKKIFAREKNIEKVEKNFYKNNDKIIGETIRNSKKNFDKYSFKRLKINASDETVLKGRLYFKEENRKTAILCHGYKSYPEFDFGNVIDYYAENGYNIILPDERAHSRSEGKYSTLGLKESYDIVLWSIWAELSFGTGCPIVLHGVSMGAFSCLVAAANPEKPKNVIKVVADSMYESVEAVVEKQINSTIGLFTKTVMKTVNMYFRSFTGCDVRDFSLLKILPKIKIPVLLFHGGKDDVFSAKEASDLKEKITSENELHVTENAKHGLSFAYETDRCIEILDKFLSE